MQTTKAKIQIVLDRIARLESDAQEIRMRINEYYDDGMLQAVHEQRTVWITEVKILKQTLETLFPGAF